ncbi:MAG: acetate--CoA ligase family protein, partial [Acidimicrobiales bacterium]
MSRLDLRALFEPRGVVVAGASTHPGKFGFVALHNVLEAGFEGPVFATNPDRPSILGVQTLASVAEVPEGRADLVMVCAPAAAIAGVLEDSAARGIRAAFVVSGGFAEAGESGRQREADLVALASRLGMVLAGPNGQGLVSTPAKLSSQIVAPYPPAGTIGVASQSGNLASTIMNLARHANIGISRAVSAGNQAMVEIADYLDYMAADPETRVIVIYVEGIPDGRRFYEALRATTPHKPVIVVKGGSSEDGARAAKSHTGSLATDDRVFDGMLHQAGAIRATGIDDAYMLAAAFARLPLPDGPRTVVLTSAGGWGVLTTDALAASSLQLMELPTDLHAAIGELVPPRWSRGNPVDLAGGETRDTVVDVLDLIVGHPDVDAVVYLGLGIQGNIARSYRESRFMPDDGMERMAGFHERQEVRYANSAVEASGRADKPVVLASELAVADSQNPGVTALRELRWPCFPTPASAIRSLDAMWRYRRQRERTDGCDVGASAHDWGRETAHDTPARTTGTGFRGRENAHPFGNGQWNDT